MFLKLHVVQCFIVVSTPSLFEGGRDIIKKKKIDKGEEDNYLKSLERKRKSNAKSLGGGETFQFPFLPIVVTDTVFVVKFRKYFSGPRYF